MFAFVQHEDFAHDVLYRKLSANAQIAAQGNTGAIVTFTGLVRDFNQQGNIDGIELEHYPGMTEAALMSLLEHASTRFTLNAAGIVHRVGRIGNNEQIVWVGAAAAHRQAAFDGACFLMDMLKQSVPLWKKEYKGSESQWISAKTSDDNAALKWMRKD